MSDFSPALAGTSVDVVVVTRNTLEMTLRCVRSARAAADGLEAKIFVVDNASSDGSAGALAAEPGVEVIVNDHNAGYGSACNQGADPGSGEFVLILNSDIIVGPQSIEALLGFMRRCPAHVACGGRVVDPGTNRPQLGHAVRAFPTVVSQIAQMAGLERNWPANPLSRRALGFDLDYELTQDVDQPPGSCLLIRRRDFEAVDGFDQGFYYWYEDVDLCKRLRRRGPIAYVHDAPFEHEGSASFAAWDRADMVRSWYPGVFRYFGKHHSPTAEFTVRGVAAILAALRALAWLPRDRERSRALMDVARLAVRSRRDR